MEPTQEEQQPLREWVEAEKTLAEIQTLLSENFKRSLTYMEVRFLLGDLGLKLKEQEKQEPQKPAEDLEAKSDPAAGGVRVTVDKVVSPGTMVSGQVTFSDGETARWMIDAMGQPRLEPQTPGYQPQQKDLMEFQQSLNKALQSQRL